MRANPRGAKGRVRREHARQAHKRVARRRDERGIVEVEGSADLSDLFQAVPR
jgi:hypothetical protein